MKKLFMLVAMAAMVSTVSAQKLGIWYGLGFNKITSDQYGVNGAVAKTKMYCAPVNFGVTYTQEISDFDIVGGLSFRQKGSRVAIEGSSASYNKDWKPKYIQLDFLGAYNFVKGEGYKFGLQTGPYVNFMVSDDNVEDVNKVDFGWQAGLAGMYKNITLSAGYEFGFIKIEKDANKKSKNSGIYVKLGYQFDL